MDNIYGTKTIKIIKASGTYPDLKYYYEMADKGHDIKTVYWTFDLGSVNCENDIDLFEGGASKYLHTKTILDDIPYLYNKDILLKKIPEWCLYEKQGKYTRGNAYSWGGEKSFSKDVALSNYTRGYVDLNQIQLEDPAIYQDKILNNIADLKCLVQSAGKTEFVFILPPYSMLWWDASYVNGILGERTLALKAFMEEVLPLENVKAYYFQADRDVICNLDNYMDLVHYTPEINQMMLEAVVNGENEIQPGEYDQIEKNMMELIDTIETEEIPKYYEY